MARSTARLKEQARSHELREEWDKAINAYVQVVQIGRQSDEPELGLYNRVGDLYLKVSKPGEAVKYYEEAADLYAQQGLYNNAIALCNKALRYLPNRLELLRKLGQFSAAQGFLTDARRWFLEYAEKAMKSNRMAEAFGALEEFAALSDDADIRELLGRQLKAHGREEDALTQLTQAYALRLRDGDTARAQALESAIREIDPDASLESAAVARGRGPSSAPAGLPGFDDDAAGGIGTADEVSAPGGLPGLETGSGFEPARRTSPALDDLPLLDPGIDEEEEKEELVAPEPGPAEEPSGLETFGALPGLVREEEEAEAEEEEDALPLLADTGEEEDEAEDEEEGVAIAEGFEAFDVGDLDLAGGSAAFGFDFGTTTEVEEEEEVEAGEEEEEEDEEDEEVEAGGPGDFDLGGAFPAAPEPEPAPAPRPVPAAPAPAPVEPELANVPAEVGASAAVGRARLLLDRGDEAGARAMLEDSADELADAGHLEEAIEVLTELTTRWPDDINGQQRRVENAFRLGRKDLLIPAYLALGGALQRSGAPHKATAVYQRVLDLDPQNAQARAALAPAAPRRREAERAPASNDGFVDLGSMLQDELGEATTRFVVPETEPTGDEERDFADMLAQFKAKVAEHLSSEDWTSHYDLGLAYKDMGLIDEAIAEFQTALRGGGERLKVYEELGQCFIQKQQFNVAVKLLGRGLQMPFDDEGDLVGVYYQLGLCYEGLGKKEEARESYERVLSLDISFRDVNERLARL